MYSRDSTSKHIKDRHVRPELNISKIKFNDKIRKELVARDHKIWSIGYKVMLYADSPWTIKP